MKNIRIENDFTITWEIQDNGVMIDLSTVENLKVEVKSGSYIHPTEFKEIRNGKMYFEIFASRVGTFSLIAEFDIVDNTLTDGLHHITIDAQAFRVVATSGEADETFDFDLITNI